MSEQVKVSVIVPVYNVEKYLPKCLDSLVNQTLEDIEIIVVNDGSPDNSQVIIDEYASRYPGKIRPLIKENGGLSDARNFGITYAKGEYIGFVDSDDYVRNDMFEILYNKADEEDSDVVVCNYNKFSDDSMKNIVEIKHIDYFNNCVEDVPEILLESKSLACNKIYRREWYIEHDFKFPVGQWYEDSAVVYNMLYLANKVSAVTNCLYFYRTDREESITNSINDKIFDIFKSCESIIIFYRNHTCNKNVLNVADRICQIHLFVRLHALIKYGTIKLKIAYYTKLLDFFAKYMPKWANNPYYEKVKKQTLTLKILHKPHLMYLYLLVPSGLINNIKRILKKENKKLSNYINHDRLRQLQLIELDILKEIDRICKENELTYYLGEGSLLGAIRHQGFIPWDDDLDIVMPRVDYEKFLEIADRCLNDKYICLNERQEPNYYLPFTKIISLNNYGFIDKLNKFDDKYRGPYVDVFPLDYCKELNAAGIKHKYNKIRSIRDALLLKSEIIKPKSKKRKVINILSKFITNRQLFAMLRKEMMCYDENVPNMCNFASSYHISKQIVPKEVYGEPKYVPFEDGMFPVPADSHTLLRTIYGNYMKMPPIEKRKSKHSFYDEISLARKNETEPLEKELMEKQISEEIRRLQLIELDILKEVDRVCKENDITYYLGEGTLLGAVRHNGFITWDDDVDIIMTRENLQKFMSICDEKLKPNYKLQYYHNIDLYWVQSPKVRLLDKTEFTQSKLKKYTDDTGPYIDIFPLDYAPDSFRKLYIQHKYIKLYRRILFLKTKFSSPKNWKHHILNLYSKCISVKTIHKRINKMATKYNNGSKKYLCNFGSYYDINKEVFPVHTLGQPVYVNFEDCEFPVPANYKYVLTTTYGDYMKLPPENERVGKHSFD